MIKRLYILFFLLLAALSVKGGNDSTFAKKAAERFIDFLENNPQKYLFKDQAFVGKKPLNDSYIESRYIGAENLFNETDPNYLNTLQLIKNFNEGSEKYDENFRFYVFHGRYFNDVSGASIQEKEYNVLKKTYLSDEETDKLGYVPLSAIQESVIENLQKNPKFSSKRITILFITEVYTIDPKSPNNYFKLKYFSFSPLALEKFEEDILTGKTPQGKWSFSPIPVGASKEVYAQAFYDIVNKGTTMLKEGRKAHQEALQAANELIRKTLNNKSGNNDKGSSWWYKFVESVKDSEAKLRGSSYNQSFGVAFYGATSTEPNPALQGVTADKVFRLDAEGLEVFETWLSKRGYTKAIQYDKSKRTIVINEKELKKQYGRDVREIVSDFAKYLADEAHPQEVENFINQDPITWAITETDLKLKKIGKTWQELDACNIAILGNCGDTRTLTTFEIINEQTSFAKGIVVGDVNLLTDYTKVDADINKICMVIYFGSSTNTSVNLSAKRYRITDPLLQVQLDKILENKDKGLSCKLEKEVDADCWKILFQNASLKKIKDEILKNPQKRKFADKISVDEQALISFYTTEEGYKEFNKALRGDIPMTLFFECYLKLLNIALNKLDNYNCSPVGQTCLYRGTTMKKTEFDSKYFEKNEFPVSFFQSTSMNYCMAMFFMLKRISERIDRIQQNTDVGVFFWIKSDIGRDISNISLAKEGEVLFKTGVKIRVDKIELRTISTSLKNSFDNNCGMRALLDLIEDYDMENNVKYFDVYITILE